MLRAAGNAPTDMKSLYWAAKFEDVGSKVAESFRKHEVEGDKIASKWEGKAVEIIDMKRTARKAREASK